MPFQKNELRDTAFPPPLPEKGLELLIIGDGDAVLKQLKRLANPLSSNSVTVIGEAIHDNVRLFVNAHPNFRILEKPFDPTDLRKKNIVITSSKNTALNVQLRREASSRKILFHSVTNPLESDFLSFREVLSPSLKNPDLPDAVTTEKKWRRIAGYLVAAFALMVTGHLIISALPLPAVQELITTIKPYFNYQFLFFVIAGFAAQMVDGALSMGYGVTSATCLMSFGVSPVSVSAAIHTSEIFTTGISGYSHYKFGNVNKKLFNHLVVPGVLGAIAGALLLVFLGERAGKWLMPLIALYAMFLGLKILFKAFQVKKANSKARRIGWLAGAGGFLDSFGGGGWGPIVTSTLVSKGRDPKYTVGSVCLTEFFVTLASAITFFLTVGVHHWNIVLGLIIGGSIAAPFAARLAGKLPKKTMMIAVGIMVITWCIRMFVKSITAL